MSQWLTVNMSVLQWAKDVTVKSYHRQVLCYESLSASRRERPKSGMQMRESRNVWLQECKNVAACNGKGAICRKLYRTTRSAGTL